MTENGNRGKKDKRNKRSFGIKVKDSICKVKKKINRKLHNEEKFLQKIKTI